MKHFIWLVPFAFCTQVQASGVGVHMFMADVALELLTDQELKTLLTDEQHAYRNGTGYPDSGYPVNARIGELSHWDKFLNAYLGHIQSKCRMPFEGECRKMFAHFMGSFAHTIGDVNWDRYFLPNLKSYGFVSVSHAQTVDFKYDFLAIVDFGRTDVVPLKYVPSKALEKVYDQLGYRYTVADVEKGTNFIFTALMTEIFSAKIFYNAFKTALPWTAEHYYDAKGGVQDTATRIAGYWQELYGYLKKGQKVSIDTPGDWPIVDVVVSGVDP